MSQREIKKATSGIKRKEIKLDELKSILEKTKPALTVDDYETLTAAVDTFSVITQELESKGVTIDRLRRLVFGPSTEKTSQVLKEILAGKNHARDQAKTPPPGHGESQSASRRVEARPGVSRVRKRKALSSGHAGDAGAGKGHGPAGGHGL